MFHLLSESTETLWRYTAQLQRTTLPSAGPEKNQYGMFLYKIFIQNIFFFKGEGTFVPQWKIKPMFLKIIHL